MNPLYTPTFIWAATWENRIFAYAKTKTQISFAMTAKLISAFGFATWIVQSLCFLNPTFQVYSHLLWLYSPICVWPGRKPRRPVFWCRGSYSKTGVYNGYTFFPIFALKHRLWVLVRTALEQTVINNWGIKINVTAFTGKTWSGSKPGPHGETRNKAMNQYSKTNEST